MPVERLERLRERVDRRGRDEDVPLRRVAVAGAAAGPVVAPRAGERLALGPARRRRRAGAGRGPSSASSSRSTTSAAPQPLPEQREPVRPVARVRVRLRRDGAGLRLGPGDDRADGEELRLHRDAPLARVEVAGDDRVRRDDQPLAVGQLRQVELEQLGGRGTSTVDDLGPRERRLHLRPASPRARRPACPARAPRAAAPRRRRRRARARPRRRASPSSAISGTRRPVAPNQRSLTARSSRPARARASRRPGASSRSCSGVPVSIGNVP